MLKFQLERKALKNSFDLLFGGKWDYGRFGWLCEEDTAVLSLSKLCIQQFA